MTEHSYVRHSSFTHALLGFQLQPKIELEWHFDEKYMLTSRTIKDVQKHAIPKQIVNVAADCRLVELFP